MPRARDEAAHKDKIERLRRASFFIGDDYNRLLCKGRTARSKSWNRLFCWVRELPIALLCQAQLSHLRQHIDAMGTHLHIAVDPTHDALLIDKDTHASGKVVFVLSGPIKH